MSMHEEYRDDAMPLLEVGDAPSVVVMGGGTGSFTLLQELKKETPDITAVVNMIDDGGSTGHLRDEYGVLPPGDVRQCLVALSEAEELRAVFDYRFDGGNGHGTFKGHSLGNVIMTGLARMHEGDFERAVEVASKILRIRGSVVPVTLGDHKLILHDGDQEVVGESNIGDYAISSSEASVRLDPEAMANPKAEAAITNADIVVIAPGNFFCSILPVLAVNGIEDALRKTTATKVAVANLMTKPNHTHGWHVADFARRIEEYVGRGTVDYVLHNNEAPDANLIEKYAEEGELPVGHEPGRFSEITAHAIGASLVAKSVTHQDPNDTLLRRTLIRHDAAEATRQIFDIWRSHTQKQPAQA